MSGQELRAARRAAGISQDELSVLLGMSQTMLSRIEQGMRAAPDDMRERLQRAVDHHEAERRRRLRDFSLA